MQTKSQRIKNLWSDIEAITSNRQALYEKNTAIYDDLMENNYDPRQRLLLYDELSRNRQQIELLTKQHRDVLDKIIETNELFERPNGRLTGLFSRHMPAHPPGMKMYHATHMSDLPSYRLLPFLVFLIVIVAFVTIINVAPWTVVSPLSLFFSGVESVLPMSSESDGTPYLMPIFVSVVYLIMVGVGVFALVKPRATWKRLYSMALYEEQWFRSGAENWTNRQRVLACILFGLCHVINLFVPIAILFVLCGVGGVFMLIYLREYSRSGDTEYATKATAKFHAVYNVYAFGFLLLSALVFLPTFLL